MRNSVGAPLTKRIGTLILVLVVFGSFGTVVTANILSGLPTHAASTQVTYTEVLLSRPVSVNVGDLMLASIAVNGGVSAVLSSAPLGWTLIASTTNDTNVSLRTYYKIATGSDTSTSTYLWQFLGQTTAEGAIIPYASASTTVPIDAWSENVGFGTIATTSSVTTTDANDEIVAIFAIDVGKTQDANNYFSTSSTPFGIAKKYDISNTPFGPSIAAMEVLQVGVGGNNSASTTIAGNKARNWVAQQIALRQAPPHGSAVFSSSGTWVAPNGVTSITVDAWGGGGGGSGGTSAESGGGAGAYVHATSVAVTGGNSYAVTVGTGGAGGTGNGAVGAGGTGYANGGNGSGDTYGRGGGGGGSSAFANDGTTIIAAGGGGAGYTVTGIAATSSAGGKGGDGWTISGTYFAGGGGGAATSGADASGSTGGAGGSGATPQTGTNGDGYCGGGSSAGISGSGSNGGSGGVACNGGTGSGGASTGIAGSGFDSGGGGQGGHSGTGGTGGIPGAGGGGTGGGNDTGGQGGTGKVIVTW